MSRRTLGLASAAVAVVAVAVVGVILVARPGSAAGAAKVPHFVEVAAEAGIHHVYDGDFDYFVGGGVAAFDCDGDYQPDLFLAGGSEPAALYRNLSAPGGPLRFAKVESEETSQSAVTGAYPLDIDGDRLTDLVVLGFGENLVLRGLGDCRFERVNDQLGLERQRDWTVGFSATWERAAKLPTLAFANYLIPGSDSTSPKCGVNQLLRPNAEGTGYDPAIPLSPSYCALSVLFSDWNRTGRHDLRVSNDRHYYGADPAGGEQLWRIDPGSPPASYTAADGWQQLRIWGMGIASQDLTGDGLPEVYLTSQGDNKLQTLTDGPSRPTYGDIALARGATATRPFTGDDTNLPSTAWHPEFQDVNNDGFVDLYVSKGNVEAELDYAMQDPSNLLIGQPDGTFVEGALEAGIVTFARARGAAIVDLNRDGLLDLVEVNRRTPVHIWRNVGAGTADAPEAMGRFIGIRLEEDGPNRDAIGAWVEFGLGDRVISREVTVGGGHAGGQLGWMQFGLGGAASAEIRVTWPDGEVGPWITVPADEYALIRRGATEPEYPMIRY
ncbi:MAG TPA: VCBS repeat-containing protein [Candidatus Limnocylindrales bacterium]|nr:VCBS repeat-containing protein [Candidatus Limnocylindrales bacterium]